MVTTETRIIPDDPALPVSVSSTGSLTIGGDINTIGSQDFSTGGVTLQAPPGEVINLRSAQGTVQFSGISESALANLNQTLNIVQVNTTPTSSNLTTPLYASFMPPLSPDEELFYPAKTSYEGEVRVSDPKEEIRCNDEKTEECKG